MLSKIHEILQDTPLLFTFRTQKEGGVHPMDTDSYVSLNKSAARSGLADLIDVEFFTGDEIVADLIRFIHENGAKLWLQP